MVFLKDKRFVLLVLVILLVVNNLYSQQINELSKKKKEIEKEIDAISNLLVKTEKESKKSLNSVRLTKKKIELKNSLIKQIDNESDQLKDKIYLQKGKIDSLNQQIGLIKNDYKRIILFNQNSKNKNVLLLLILTAKDFNQAYKRIKYYQQIFNYKKKLVSRYYNTINVIKEVNEKLSDNLNMLSKKQTEKEYEVVALKKEEGLCLQKINELSKKKSELLSELEEQKKISKKINDEIKRLIEEEAKREAENRNVNTQEVRILLSNNFRDNIGKFNLPINGGIVTGNYGESFHPVLKEVKIKNNGIDITLSQKSDVFSIFKGEVRKIFKVPGSNLAIIIRHGRYLTVYTNLTKINVAIGQEINTYQKIGEISLQRGEETSILHFELWNENKTEDPSKWFRKSEK
ncbi:MAG: peptidoglycan DD-metalloendopeptidase family protein [Bacteroidales bacterium]|nr:peptidoglycan DD-metalloendopeptidase family protein [Bacteroidales bacterium]